MADVNINKFRASVVRDGSKPASPGFIVSEGQDPVDPAGNGQNHLPVTIATAATGLSITDSQVLGGAGNVGQYIRGDGSLADFPQASGGGSSVSYYLNGSISQGTIGGVAYKELNKVPILGAGTDFTINADGYIASFLTDAGDPNLLEIPGGNWNFETYFSASSSGGSPSFYVELYKYDGTTFTLIASSSSSPELIAFGTNLNPYFSTLAVPTTTLALTDRLAIRYYVTHSGRTITLHTENNHLCQVVTTFTTGLTSLNGLTAQVQNLAVGTSGTDFNIASATATHTFNLPTASATNRGALSSADWTTFNNKQNALGYVPVPETRTITINGVSQDLSANRTYNVGTVTSVGLSSATSGVTIGGSPVTGVGAFTLAIATASGSQNGLLSSTDWTTFNSKQNALTNPVTGTGSAGQVAYWSSSSAITGESNLFWDATNDKLSIGTATAYGNLTVSGSDNTDIFTVLAGPNSRLHVGTVGGSNTYIRSQNSYALYLGVNNTNYIYMASGNVGINTATPATTLEVDGVGLFSGTSLAGNTKNGVYIYDQTILSLAGGNSRPLNIQSQTLSIYTGTTYSEKVKVFENGNVVISTSPSDAGFKLDVNGTGRFTNTLTPIILRSTNANTMWTEYYYNTSTLSGYVGSGSGLLSGANASDFIVRSEADFVIATGGNNRRLTLASTGEATFSSSVTLTNSAEPIIFLNTTSTNKASAIVTTESGTSKWAFGTNLGTGDNSFNVYNYAAGARYLTITSGGNVLIGTTTNPGFKLYVSGSGNVVGITSSDNTLSLGLGTTGTMSGYLGASGSALYAYSTNGGYVLLNSSSVWVAASDLKRKRNFENYNLGLNEILGLKPKYYHMDFQKDSEQKQVGLVAQEVKDFIPLAYEDNRGFIGLNYNAIIVTMVKAIQELNEKIK